MSPNKKKQRAPQTARSVPGTQRTIINQLVIRPIARQKSNVADWRSGLQSADMGRVKKLFDLEEDLLIDGYLSDAISKRIDAVTNSELTFQGADGNEVYEIATLIDSPAWEDLLTEIMHQRFWGRSGVEFDFTTGFGVKPIPPKHIKLENKQILLNEYDDSGISYEGDDHILILGKPRDFGLLLKAAPFAIYKRGAFGDYAQWLEIFGMPQRIGKYSSYDPESRKLLEQAFEQAGSAPYIVIPKESDIETKEASSAGAGKSPFNEFRQACNEEILITILGQTMTTIQGDKGARSLGEVHKEVEEGKNKSDMRFVQRILNHFVLPMLEKRGFPVTGGKFIFPKAAQTITVEEIVKLAGIMPIPTSYLHEKYSIPVAVDGEPIAGSGKPSAPGDAPDQIEPEEDPPKGKKKKEKPVDQAPEKKPIKNADHGLGRRIKDFFALAPLEIRGAIRTLFLADQQNNVEHLIDIQALFNRAIKDIYRHKTGAENQALINEKLFEITNSALQDAVDKTFAAVGAEWGRVNLDFVKEFKENASVFAAFKNHEQTDQIVQLLYREDGSIRSFSEFKSEALKISEGYNKKYLQTEYNTAVKAARAAVNWKKFQETKHLYPNLEYMPSRAVNPRDSHRVYWNMIWAIDDPIWSMIMPPSDWNCSCGVRATDKPVSELSPDWEMPQTDPVFRNNPGVTAQIVNTEATDYYKNTPERFRPEVIKFAAEVMAGLRKGVTEVYTGRSGGFVNIVRQNGNEAAKNLITYKLLAEHGGQYTLLELQKSGKNPDALNVLSGMLSDAKHPLTASGKNAIQNSIKLASEQGVGEVVIRLLRGYTNHELWDGLKASLQEGRAKTLKKIIIIRLDNKPAEFEVKDIRAFLKKTKGRH